jgi:hypothetical protein
MGFWFAGTHGSGRGVYPIVAGKHVFLRGRQTGVGKRRPYELGGEKRIEQKVAKIAKG